MGALFCYDIDTTVLRQRSVPGKCEHVVEGQNQEHMEIKQEQQLEKQHL